MSSIGKLPPLTITQTPPGASLQIGSHNAAAIGILKDGQQPPP